MPKLKLELELELRLALVQLAVVNEKPENVRRAISFIEEANKKGADIVTLPECFNSSYGAAHFPKYAETIPNGETSNALSEAAKRNKIYIIGGTIPEREGDKLYNTATVWDPQGNLIAKYRKILHQTLHFHNF
ncbi:omega-amidase NIT2-like [Leptopilina heterotoma]|uniref:omega-amidase NIT2-like n=1 Tax=Leptopilina heterotoma TaxID=63436 RepID=UPI001CA8249C|nr:omega-amidase NIT2-like [Leptopilina heterotoma]